jgi:hypothetical protein
MQRQNLGNDVFRPRYGAHMWAMTPLFDASALPLVGASWTPGAPSGMLAGLMRRTRRFGIAWIGFLFVCSAIGYACSSAPQGTSESADAGSGSDVAIPEAPKPRPDASTNTPSDRTTCETTLAFAKACGTVDDLNCGSGFEAWCDANDRAINSDTYRRAEARCLVPENCELKKRIDCEYRSYSSETPTTAQAALVSAYCARCAPEDVAGCTNRATIYDPNLGPGSIENIFIAAWELNDSIVAQITSTCLGSLLSDGGAPTDASAVGDAQAGDADAGTAEGSYAACEKAFGSCAADIYLARLPDCP